MRMLLPLVAAFGACAPQPAPSTAAAAVERYPIGPHDNFESDPYIRLPVIDAWHEGQKVWFLHTSVSSQEMADRLTGMVDYSTWYVPRLGEVDPAHAAPIYVFTNGVSHEGEEPWGGGPFHFQIDVLGSIPGDQDYTPLRNPHLVSWIEPGQARVLTSEAEVLAAAEAGEVTVEATDVIVTAPIVAWPGAEPAPVARR